MQKSFLRGFQHFICRDKLSVDAAIALWVGEDLRPASIVGDSGLQRVIDAVVNWTLEKVGSEMELKFQLPDPSTMTEKVKLLANDIRSEVSCLRVSVHSIALR